MKCVHCGKESEFDTCSEDCEMAMMEKGVSMTMDEQERKKGERFEQF